MWPQTSNYMATLPLPLYFQWNKDTIFHDKMPGRILLVQINTRSAWLNFKYMPLVFIRGNGINLRFVVYLRLNLYATDSY